MQLQRIIETCLYVDDLAAAEQFYSQALGLSVYSRVAGRHVFFRCGQGMLLLFDPAATQQSGGNIPPHGAHGAGHVAFAIGRAEIGAWRERLRQQQIAIESEVAWPSGGYSLYVRDPAGNSVELTTPQTWELPETA
ncbi:MAG TPA: VOC family protein [Herpetosiphonaceae bacterium]